MPANVQQMAHTKGKYSGPDVKSNFWAKSHFSQRWRWATKSLQQGHIDRSISDDRFICCGDKSHCVYTLSTQDGEENIWKTAVWYLFQGIYPMDSIHIVYVFLCAECKLHILFCAEHVLKSLTVLSSLRDNFSWKRFVTYIRHKKSLYRLKPLKILKMPTYRNWRVKVFWANY